jgi:hypothetical protein
MLVPRSPQPLSGAARPVALMQAHWRFTPTVSLRSLLRTRWISPVPLSIVAKQSAVPPRRGEDALLGVAYNNPLDVDDAASPGLACRVIAIT